MAILNDLKRMQDEVALPDPRGEYSLLELSVIYVVPSKSRVFTIEHPRKLRCVMCDGGCVLT